MTIKSYVSMEQHQCPVCGAIHETGGLLLDKRMRNVLDKYTVTGLSLCPEHQAKVDEGFVILVEVSNAGRKATLKPHEAGHTGNVAYLKKEIFNEVFDLPAPDEGVGFIDTEVFSQLNTMAEQANNTLQ